MHYDVTRGNGARTKRPPAAGGRPREEAAREQSAPAAKPRESGRGASLPPWAGGGGEGAGLQLPWCRAAGGRGVSPGTRRALPGRGRRGRLVPVGAVPRPASRLFSGAPSPPARPPARRAPLAALPAQPKIGAWPFPAARSPRRRLLTARGSAVGPGVPGGRPPRAAGACGAPACVLPVPLAVSKLGTGAPAEEVWVQEEPVAAGLLSERGETLRSVAG